MTDANKTVQTETKVVETASGEVKITQPKGKHHRGVTVLLDSEDVRDQVGGFVNFLRERAVVGLAVGFIVGLQAQTFMKQLVDSFVVPMLTFLLGSDLIHKHFTLHSGTTPIEFAWGSFIYSFVSLVAVVLIVYLLVKVLRLDRLDQPKGKK